MENNFDLRKFLTENKLTANSKLLNEEVTIEPQQGDKAAYEKLTKLFDWDDIDPDLGVEFSDEYGLEEFPEWEDQTWTDEIESHIKEQGAQMKKIATVGIKGTYIDQIYIYDIDGKYAALIDDYNQGCTVTSLQKGQELIQQAQDIAGRSGMNENALPDYEDADYPVAQAFEKAGVDMSRPIHVIRFGDRWDEEDLGEKDPKQFAAELEGERQAIIKDLESYHDYMPLYEFENNTVDPIPDGLEYKLCFAVFESHDFAILQAPSGMNEGQIDLSSEESIMQAIEDAAQNYMDDDTSREQAMALAAEDIYDLARGEGNEDAMAIANSIIRGGMNESRRRSAGRRLNESRRRTQAKRRK